jgi:hypothetical protein
VKHYFIYKQVQDKRGNVGAGIAYHWFSAADADRKDADSEVSWRRPLFLQNEWTVFRAPDLPTVPAISHTPQTLPREYVWFPDKSLVFPPLYPYSFYLHIPCAAQYGLMKVAYFLGMWPIYKDYVERPEDPSIWPIRGLIVSGPVTMQHKLRKLVDYQWRYDIRYRGRRSVPGGYIPMHYVAEDYFLDGTVPEHATLRSAGDRGLSWVDFEAGWRMV